jgi:hypothetical protein
VEGLSGVRRELATWVPPEAAGFSLVSAAAPVPPPPSRWWSPVGIPAWARLAAAMLVVAASLSVLNLQISYGGEGLRITTGWMAPPSPGQAVAPAVRQSAREEPAGWQPALAALEATLRDEIRAARPASPPPAALRGTDVSIERVTDLIAQSEQRQKQELALRMAQFGRDLEVQRRSDLVRINQGFGQFEGRAGAEIARQRQMLDYIMRVSAQPPPQ